MEIWDKRHAFVSDVFNDINSHIPVTDLIEDDKEYDFDEELLYEWNKFTARKQELETECDNSQEEAEDPTLRRLS